MQQYVVLGVDAGTHGVRALALDVADRRAVAQSVCAYSRISRGDTQTLDATALENAFFQALESLTLPDGCRVEALGVTHQRGTVIPVDADCRPLAPAFCDSDNRALCGDGFLESGLDPQSYYETSGCPVVPFNGLAKILWCRRHMPTLYQKTAAWLSPQDYMLSRLTGRMQLTEGSALRNGYLDVEKRRLASFPGLETPFTRFSCTPVGGCCGKAADRPRISFLKDLPLYAVPGDQPAAFLAVGAASPARAAMNLGTTFVASVRSAVPARDRQAIVTTEVLPFGLYAPEFGTGAGGQFMDFLTNLFFGGPPMDAATWTALDQGAGDIAPGGEGLRIVPLLWQATSAGAQGRMEGLKPFHTRAHFVRAAYEGLACEARLSLEKLAECTEVPGTLAVFGGMSRCNAFLDILASMTGKRVEAAAQTQASAQGAALCCMIGLGIFADMEQISMAMESSSRVYMPRNEAFYDTYFQEYGRLRRGVSA